jgi:hypothetical protein
MTTDHRKPQIPATYPVQPIGPDEPAEDRATCGHCHLSWDDGKVTSMTPAPSARCPFEPFHRYATDRDDFTISITPIRKA